MFVSAQSQDLWVVFRPDSFYFIYPDPIRLEEARQSGALQLFRQSERRSRPKREGLGSTNPGSRSTRKR